MEYGSPCMLETTPLMGSEINEMPISLENGIQIQVRKVLMNDSHIWLAQILTYEHPVWRTVCAGETPTIALMAACRIVGATDTVLQGATKYAN
jgi:hypothetical protein